MRRMLISFGFLLSLMTAAVSFSSIMNDDASAVPQLSQQSFFIPRSSGAGIDECLTEGSDCGKAAAASICQTHGYHNVIAFGEASPEDLTGSTEKPKGVQKVASNDKQDLPFIVTCAR